MKSRQQLVLEYVKDHPGCTTRQVTEALDLINNTGARNALHTLKYQGKIDGAFDGWYPIKEVGCR